MREASAGLDVHPVQLDVTDPAQREAVVSEILEKPAPVVPQSPVAAIPLTVPKFTA